MMRKALRIILITLPFVACAPAVKHPAPPNTKPHFGPQQTDSTLRFNGPPTLYEKLPSFSEQTFATADIINGVEDLRQLSLILGQSPIAQLGQQILSAIYNNNNLIKSVGFEKSPYADAILRETKPQALQEIEQVLRQIDSQKKLIIALLNSRANPPRKDARLPFTEFPSQVKSSLVAEVNFLAQHGVESYIIDSIRKAMATEIYPRLAQAEPLIKQLMQAPTLNSTLLLLEKIFSVFDFKPDKELKTDIDFGYSVAHEIDQMSSEQEALTLIVKFWRLMTPQERLENFRATSPELYEYLRERTPPDLTCLASDSCLDVVILLGKRQIFAGLRDYGLSKLQKTFNRGAISIVIEKIESTTPKEIANIPLAMKDQIVPRIVTQTEELVNIRDHFDSFLRQALESWAKNTIYSSQRRALPLLESPQLRLKMNLGKPEIIGTTNSNISYEAQTIGSSLALTALRWKLIDPNSQGGSHTINLMRNMIETINKMLLTYDQYSNRVSAREPKQFDTASTGELLRGLSLISHHLRDYQPSIYDSNLGKIKIRELDIDIVPEKIADQPLFPKDAAFAMAIGTAALRLQSLNTTPSPIFTVDTENKIHWLDRAVENPNSPNIMAGVVDVINGKRSQLVKSSNLSKFLAGLVAFYTATEELEKTKAPRLLETGADGKTNLASILESREDIRDLIIGLSNFLSHQIKNKNGSTIHAINLNDSNPAGDGTLYLEDQINSIDALLDSYELLHTNMYLWSAIDTYFAMNQRLWNSKTDFYFSDSKENPPNFFQRVHALKVIARLKNYIDGTSRQQAERILFVNTKAFGPK